MYPRLSISNKKPSAHITGPLSNLSFNLFVLIFFPLVLEKKGHKIIRGYIHRPLFSFLVLKQMQGAQYGSTARLNFMKDKKKPPV
jgi:hypothetical protein